MIIKYLFQILIPIYLYDMDNELFIEDFTVGYHVIVRKRWAVKLLNRLANFLSKYKQMISSSLIILLKYNTRGEKVDYSKIDRRIGKSDVSILLI